MLNGRLYPFPEMNEGSVSDYVELQRLTRRSFKFSVQSVRVKNIVQMAPRASGVHSSQMRLANSFGDRPGSASPWCGRSL